MGKAYDPWVGNGKRKPGGPPAWGTVYGAECVSEASAPMLRQLLEHRQGCALLLAYGILVAVAGCPVILGNSDSTDTDVIGVLKLVSGVTAVVYGLFGMLSGFFGLVADRASSALSVITIVLVFMAWFVLGVGLAGIIFEWVRSPDEQSYFPDSMDDPFGYEDLSNATFSGEYLPVETDVLVARIVELFTVVAYAAAVNGALTFFALKTRAFQRSGACRYNGPYFRWRLGYYSGLVCLAAATQLTLGIYLLASFGTGPFTHPATVGLYVVFVPEVAIVVGGLQLALGVYGMARSLLAHGRNHHFVVLSLLVTIISVGLQVVLQTSWAPDGQLAAESASSACLVIGLLLMPAYLDAKMRTIPAVLRKQDFSLAERYALASQDSLNVSIRARTNEHQQPPERV